jgi:hypothetical protein
MTRLLLVGDFAELGDIPDPIDGDAAQFSCTYDRISAAIAALGPLLHAAAPPGCRDDNGPVFGEVGREEPVGGRS